MNSAVIRRLVVTTDLPGRFATAVLLSFCWLAVAVAAAISTGGHASLDSIQQMYEAQIGQSVSWNPPFMSALLGGLGVSRQHGAGLALPLFVAFVCAMLWGSYTLALLSSRARRVPVLGFLLVIVLVTNPVVLLYAGIIWKDVLFAAATALAISLALISLSAGNPCIRLGVAISCAAVLGVLPHIRQQGVVMMPVLLVLPVLAMYWMPRVLWPRRQLLGIGAVLIASLATYTLAKSWAAASIPGNDGRSISVGFNSIYKFDLAGIEAFERNGPLVAMGAGSEALAELRDHYTPERIDFFARSPHLVEFLKGHEEELFAWWRFAVTSFPNAYVTHRKEVLAALFGFAPPLACLPVHLGVDGFEHQMSALQLTPGSDAVDRRLYQLAVPWFGMPPFKHWSYFAAFLLVAAVALLGRRGRTRVVLGIISLTILVFYASFVPTAIACDFRYLFPAIPCLTILAIAVFFQWREAAERSGYQK
ncbi:MAG: hypothetical protein KatS3mg127_1914 [Silanimonas sp.]|nr:MAG: hypothetical protein KatS3mg127_1914 [Silanimonas sp.]